MTAEQKPKFGGNNMKISQEGMTLIKHYEGCKLESYQCAAGVWTIGYGSTKDVKEGMKITQEDAEKLLKKDDLQLNRTIESIRPRYSLTLQFPTFFLFLGIFI